MKNVIIDFTDITSEQQLHTLLADKLSFPEWYGCNLDALFDCLTDLSEETAITFVNSNTPDVSPDVRIELLLQVFQDAAEENNHLHLGFSSVS